MKKLTSLAALLLTGVIALSIIQSVAASGWFIDYQSGNWEVLGRQRWKTASDIYGAAAELVNNLPSPVGFWGTEQRHRGEAFWPFWEVNEYVRYYVYCPGYEFEFYYYGVRLRFLYRYAFPRYCWICDWYVEWYWTDARTGTTYFQLVAQGTCWDYEQHPHSHVEFEKMAGQNVVRTRVEMEGIGTWYKYWAPTTGSINIQNLRIRIDKVGWGWIENYIIKEDII